MEKLQQWLDAINRRFGAVGGLISVAFWLAVLFLALESMVSDY